MGQTFANAPLVEIVADLRWDAQVAIAGLGSQGLPIKLVDGGADEFMMRFGGIAYSLGFERAERLVPPGFPVPVGQPIYRYKPAETTKREQLMQSALLQIGPGVFSANAVPPYKSWDEFSPTVRSGIEALLKARPDAEKGAPFNVSLRYIDAFRSEHWAGEPLEGFIQKVLGFRIELPEAIKKQQQPGSPTQSHLQLKLQLPGDMTLALNVGAGVFNGEPVALMHMQAVADAPVAPELDALMATLGKAREVIHNSFVEMTASIHASMKPEGV